MRPVLYDLKGTLPPQEWPQLFKNWFRETLLLPPSPPQEEDPLSCGKCKFFSCLIQGRSAKFWGRSKAILPQSGVAIICKRPQDRIRLFDPTNAPRPPLPCPASCPPICFPQFPSHPSSPQFVNFRLEGTRRRRKFGKKSG